MNVKGVNQKQIKTTNQSLIVREIRRAGTLSRSALAKRLMLSAPTVSANIDDLIARGIIRETGAGVSARGRKPIKLEFNTSYGYVAAVDMSSSRIRIALADLGELHILEYAHVDQTLHITPAVIERTLDEIESLLEKRQIPHDKLLCICMASPGIFDPRTGAIRYAPRIRDMQGTDLIDLVNKRFATDILLKNDTNCSAVGEHLYGLGRNYRNFINVQIDVGLGAGLILNDRLFEGASGSAGEIGLWIMNEKEMRGGKRIALDDYADYHISVFGLLSKIQKRYPDIFSGLGYDEIPSHLVEKYADIMFAMARAGDVRALSVIREGAIEFGCMIKNVLELLDLEAVIIGGLILEIAPIYTDMLHSFLLKIMNREVHVVASDLGDKSVLYGAIGEAIQRTIDNIIMNPR